MSQDMDAYQDFQMDLTELSIEELMGLKLEDVMNYEITSLSKKTEKLSKTAAAVFVITQEDIRRSGATSIPEALRMAPGMQVARIDSNKWAISARGFNDLSVSKFLVMIDGRTVFMPVISGMFWDVQDVVMDDIEQIEIVRGPGAAYWDSNAVNGIINIITKSAKGTQGGLISAGVGNKEHGTGTVRYGGKIGENTHYRVYTKYLNWDDFVSVTGRKADDGWDMIRGGFRLDAYPSEKDTWTLHGDVYSGAVGSTYDKSTLFESDLKLLPKEQNIEGGNLLARWSHVLADSSDFALQLYYDRSYRDLAVSAGSLDMFDVDFRHHFALGDFQDIVWGARYRLSSDNIKNSSAFSFSSNQRSYNLFSAFLHDDMTILENKLHLIIGSKVEHNDFTGFEFQPSVQLLWTPDNKNTIWTAISRTVRTPSRANHDSHFLINVRPDDPRNPLSLPILVEASGNKDVISEELIALELGYRVLLTNNLTLDLAAFYNQYDNLVTGEPGFLESPSPDYLLLPVTADNKGYAETYGFDVASDYRIQKWWRLVLGYTYLQMQLHHESNSDDFFFEKAEGESPDHVFTLRSMMDISKNVEFDLWLRYVSDLPALNVPGYLTLDARLGWQPTKNFDISLVGQNLLDNHHPEFGNPKFIPAIPSEIERSFFLKLTWRF